MPGLGGISMWQLLIILVIVILIFGTKRLKTLGGDLGGALKSFRKAMDDKDAQEEKKIESSNKDATFEEHKEKESSSK
ncbi:MAG: twin-arginine translocase TatA/TatE family subunit [Gammaproteobacteria bacterium]|jgi:sec-independent protein translocase protein TatA|nr:twin-arginine translocase TatA/TatE family subunit [Pseudomonadota bacterium]